MKSKKLKVLTKPLSVVEMRRMAKKDENWLKGVVAIDLDECIKLGQEGFLDLLSARLTDSTCLMDFSYKVVGHGPNNTLFVEVYGDGTMILEDAE